MADKYEVGPGFYVKVDLLDTSDATKEVLRKIAESGDFLFWVSIAKDEVYCHTFIEYIRTKFSNLYRFIEIKDLAKFMVEERTQNAKRVFVYAHLEDNSSEQISEFLMEANACVSAKLGDTEFDEIRVNFVYDPQFDYEDTA